MRDALARAGGSDKASLELSLSRRALAGGRRRAAAGGRVTLMASVVAVDATGNRRRATRTVRLTR